MIRKVCLTLGAAAVALVSIPREAHATCGGSSFATCATVNISKALLADAPVQLSISAATLAGVNGAIKFAPVGALVLPVAPTFLVVTPTVTPEPASLSLIATGLIGLGSFGLRRRRRAK